MLRTCDGTDPNLIDAEGSPCACGEVFDDVERMVIFPHHVILGRLEKDKLWDKVHSAVGVPYVWNAGPPTEHGGFLGVLPTAPPPTEQETPES